MKRKIKINLEDDFIIYRVKRQVFVYCDNDKNYQEEKVCR